MRNLSDTIIRLNLLNKQAGKSFSTGVDRLKDLGDFGSNPGALRARLYVPDDLPDNAPLVVVLHGCTQTAASYDHGSGWSKLADQEGFAVLYPEQSHGNNPNLCFNWFVPEDTRRDGGEALSIRHMIERAVVMHGLDRGRIYVTGLSAGGAMTSVMLATYPEILAGGAIIAGLPYGCANTIPEAFDRMRGHGGPTEQQLQQELRDASPHKGPWPRISVWHGSADHTVASSNARAVVGQWHGVHGVGSSELLEDAEGFSRRVWSDADGLELIEEIIIAGMGHGAPLWTEGQMGLGVAGPFMLDVGVSSTRRIAEFWGIAKSHGSARTQAGRPAPTPSPFKTFDRRTTRSPVRPSSTPSPESGSTSGIQKTIGDALRSAGLMP